MKVLLLGEVRNPVNIERVILKRNISKTPAPFQWNILCSLSSRVFRKWADCTILVRLYPALSLLKLVWSPEAYWETYGFLLRADGPTICRMPQRQNLEPLLRWTLIPVSYRNLTPWKPDPRVTFLYRILTHGSLFYYGKVTHPIENWPPSSIHKQMIFL